MFNGLVRGDRSRKLLPFSKTSQIFVIFSSRTAGPGGKKKYSEGFIF